MGNSHCKNDYSNGEVNLVKITQIRLQKNKKNMGIARFYYFIIWLVKIGKRSIVCCSYKKGKNAWFVLFLKSKKLT